MPDFHLVTGIDNRPMQGFVVAGEEQGFKNGRLRPDEAASFFSPLVPKSLNVIADPVTQSYEAIPEAPRNILRSQIRRLEAEGISAIFASELEFYVFKQSFTEAHRCRADELDPFYYRHGDNDVLVAGLADEIVSSIEAALEASDITVDQFQGEGGAGQFEINLAPASTLMAADNHIVFKHTVKAVGHVRGHSVTFLAKPFGNDVGSGGHIHLSLSGAHGDNALGMGRDFTELGRSFLAGLLAYTPELTLMHAPLVNSYKRLVPNSFTPLRSTWGWDNRTAMVRLVPGSDGPRIEFRLPGADVNPYHSYAAIIAAGLRGLQGKRKMPKEKIGGRDQPEACALPRDLNEATRMFASSDVATTAFGESVTAHLLMHASHEIDAQRLAVTDWEFARGFEHA